MNKKNNIDFKKINNEILELKKNLMNLNFQKNTGQLEKTNQIKNTKINIARAKAKFTNNAGEKNA